MDAQIAANTLAAKVAGVKMRAAHLLRQETGAGQPPRKTRLPGALH